MVAGTVSWGLSDEDDRLIGKELPISKCTEEQLGLVEENKDETLFYPVQ